MVREEGEQRFSVGNVICRRAFCGRLGMVATIPLLSSWAWAQESQLPLRTPGLEHFGMLVPDVETAGRFYARVFNPKLHQEIFRGSLRYYVTLGPVGYIALGAIGEREIVPEIDHYCNVVEDYDSPALAEEMKSMGLESGNFGMIPDPDDLRLQLLPVPGGLASQIEPAGRIVEEDALVTPHGLDHFILTVTDLDESLEWYRAFFGEEASRDSTSAWFEFSSELLGHTRLGIKVVPEGEKPKIDHFSVKVAPFDRDAVARQLTELGATIIASEDEGEEVLRFKDLNGIGAELKAI